MNTLALAALLGALACAGANAADRAVPPKERPGEVSDVSEVLNGAEQPQAQARACYGGLEDGKVVVRAGHFADESAETTVERCRVGGGITGRMPRSPTIAAGRPAFA